MLDRRDHDRQADFVHDDTKKVDGRHTVRSKGVRRNCVCAVLEASSKNEEDGNQTGLDDETGLKKDTTENGVGETKGDGKLPVMEKTNV